MDGWMDGWMTLVVQCARVCLTDDDGEGSRACHTDLHCYTYTCVFIDFWLARPLSTLTDKQPGLVVVIIVMCGRGAVFFPRRSLATLTQSSEDRWVDAELYQPTYNAGYGVVKL